MEFKETNNHCAVYTGSQIYHRNSCRKTSPMASITSSGIKISSINASNNFLGQSIGNFNSAPSRIPCTHKTHRHRYSLPTRSCANSDVLAWLWPEAMALAWLFLALALLFSCQSQGTWLGPGLGLAWLKPWLMSKT